MQVINATTCFWKVLEAVVSDSVGGGSGGGGGGGGGGGCVGGSGDGGGEGVPCRKGKTRRRSATGHAT